MRRSTWILGILLVASAAGNVSFLVTGLMAGGQQRATGVEQLALTDAQRERFDTEKQEVVEKRRAFTAEMRRLQSALADAFAQETPDRDRLLALSAQMSTLQATRKPESIDSLLRLHSVLTSAQRQALSALLKKSNGCCVACPGASVFPTEARTGPSGEQ